MRRLVLFPMVSLVLALAINTPLVSQSAPVQLDWLAYQTLGQPDPDSAIVKDVEKRFNVKFNFAFVDDQKWNDMLNIKLAAGEVPDVIRLRTDLAKYVQQGVVGELPIATIKQYAPNYYKTMQKFDPEGMTWDKVSYGGKNYGFSSISLSNTYGTNLVWRLDWLKKVGINKVPETLKEFEAAMYAFTNKDPDGNGKNDTYGMSNTVMPAVMGMFGWYPLSDYRGSNSPSVQFTKVNGKWVSAANQPGDKEGLALLAKWYKDGVIDPEFITGENRGGYWALSHSFINNKVGVTGSIMYYHWQPKLEGAPSAGSCLIEMQKLNPDAEYGKTVIISKTPVGPTGKSGASQWALAAETIVVSAKAAKDPAKVKAILSMLDALYTDTAYTKRMIYGEKDADFTEDAAGNVYGNSAISGADFRKRGVGVFTFLQQPPEMMKVFNKNAYVFADSVKSPGYQYPAMPPTNAASKYASTLSRLASETYIKMILGTQSMDTWDAFVKQFNSQGSDEWLKELNS